MPLPPAPGRLGSGLLALVLSSAVAVLASAPPAAAHGTLATSAPADGSTVSQPLTAVELYFTEQVAGNAYFTVTAPGGVRVDGGWTHGEPKPLDQPVREYFLVDGKFEPREYATGFPAVVRIAHLPATGQYSVSYLTVASDGDPVRGATTFRYTGPTKPAPQGWRPPTDQPDPTLLAAAEQHSAPGPGPATISGSPSAAPAASSPPAAASAPVADDEGGLGWVVCTGLAVVVTAVAGLVVRRRHPAGGASGRNRASGRSRASGVAVDRRGTGTGSRARGGPIRRDDGAGTLRPELSNPRLALLVGGLVVTLLTGFGLGRIGAGDQRTTSGAQIPTTRPGEPVAAGQAMSTVDGHQHAAGTGPHEHPGDGDTSRTQAAGTTVSAGGYTLRPVERSQPAGVTVDYRFRIIGTDRRAATGFAVVHEKTLHLIVVGRDLAGYQHLHPTMASDGTWSVPLKLSRPGGYRIYADFSVTTPGGSQLPLVLGVDHLVPGAHSPTALPPPHPAATAGPYTVSMDGAPAVGMMSPTSFRIDRSGTPAQVERYLGAYGHLVVVREGDLGYVHVHPEAELVDGAVKFWLTPPSPGRYRAFFDFQVDGAVHTAEYTIDVR
ncbi:copper resistance protein CopC [Micromonospora sp. NPDC023737]|uniref:copper resistance CopC family protein n=1 Tax=unclassified Micromonospora TaxID=2617518 RepID=UPI0033F70913